MAFLLIGFNVLCISCEFFRFSRKQILRRNLALGWVSAADYPVGHAGVSFYLLGKLEPVVIVLAVCQHIVELGKFYLLQLDINAGLTNS